MAPGIDNIKYMHIIQAPEQLQQILAKIYNLITQYGYIPKQWKETIIKMIPKNSKDSTNPKNYRPISLTSTLLKLYEKIINERIVHYLHSNNIIPLQQAAYRKKTATTHQLHRLTNYLANRKTNMKVTAAVYLDIQGAFDTVWHRGLILKIIQSGLPIQICRVLYNYLQNRTLTVQIHKSKSKPIIQENGIPQGGVLSTILYTLYTADLPQILNENTKIAMYADDVCLYSSGRFPKIAIKNLQIALDSYQQYCKKWHTIINAEKTQAIIYAHYKKHRKPVMQLHINNHYINWAKNVKYLGVTTTNNHKFQLHISNQINKAKQKLNTLKYIFRTVNLSNKTKEILYLLHVRPILTYAIPAFYAHLSTTQINKLKQIQAKAIKAIYHLPVGINHKLLHIISNIEPLETHILRLITKYTTTIDEDFMIC